MAYEIDCRVLEIDNLCLGYDVPSLDNADSKGISLTLDAGEIALVLSPSDIKLGRDKLLASVIGKIPFLGGIKIAGHPAGSREAKYMFGYVPVGLGGYREMTCLNYLAMFADIYEVDDHYRPYVIREALDMVGMNGYDNTAIGDIADPYKLRCLGIARALVHNPRLLVIDEVLLNVQSNNLRGFLEILRRVRDSGKALLLSDSRLADLNSIVDKVCYLKHYESFLSGRLDDLSAELNNYCLYTLQLLEEQSLEAFVKDIGGLDRVLMCNQCKEDPLTFRILYNGASSEFYDYLRKLEFKQIKLVSYWEDSAFFAHSLKP